jgi:hypothetical protein
MPQRNWLITGVSSGFGRIMTEQLLARGDRIAGTVRDLSVMDDLKAEYGNRLWLAELDLSETASIRCVASTSCANGPRRRRIGLARLRSASYHSGLRRALPSKGRSSLPRTRNFHLLLSKCERSGSSCRSASISDAAIPFELH